MSLKLTRQEQIEAMRRMGLGDAAIARWEEANPDERPAVAVVDAPAMPFPIRLTLPWSALCSDNFREVAHLTSRYGKPAASKKLDGRYKTAREKVRQIARSVVGDATAVAVPLSLRALVYVPDERPHDVCNFAKCCLDALEKILYVNDRWLHDVRWVRAGVDCDAPRADIEIRPL